MFIISLSLSPTYVVTGSLHGNSPSWCFVVHSSLCILKSFSVYSRLLPNNDLLCSIRSLITIVYLNFLLNHYVPVSKFFLLCNLKFAISSYVYVHFKRAHFVDFYNLPQIYVWNFLSSSVMLVVYWFLASTKWAFLKWTYSNQKLYVNRIFHIQCYH